MDIKIFIIVSIFIVIFLSTLYNIRRVEHLLPHSTEILTNIDTMSKNEKIITDKVQIGNRLLSGVDNDDIMRVYKSDETKFPSSGIAVGKISVGDIGDLKTKFDNLQDQINKLRSRPHIISNSNF